MSNCSIAQPCLPALSKSCSNLPPRFVEESFSKEQKIPKTPYLLEVNCEPLVCWHYCYLTWRGDEADEQEHEQQPRKRKLHCHSKATTNGGMQRYSSSHDRTSCKKKNFSPDWKVHRLRSPLSSTVTNVTILPEFFVPFDH